MRYNTKEEIEATGEWLLRINSTEVCEELMYVPSELTKLGVTPAPVDVVDRLKQLRESTKDPAEVEAHVDEPEAEESAEEIETPEPEEKLDELSLTPVAPSPLVFDYDRYGAWEWAEPIEKMVLDAILAVYDLVPDIPRSNLLASESRPTQPRARGKRARSVMRSAELVSLSVGATEQ